MAFALRLDGRDHRVELVARRPDLVLRIDGRDHVVRTLHTETGARALEIDGRRIAFEAELDASAVLVHLHGRTSRVDVLDPRDGTTASGAGSDAIVADMPGVLLSVGKSEGDAVVAGDVILTIESMKLQMHLCAPRDGRIARIACAANQTFDRGQTLVELEPLEPA